VKDAIATLLGAALRALSGQLVPAEAIPAQLPIEHTRDVTHGDFASNIAMLLAKRARRSPRELAERIVAALPADARIAKVEVAGPGFINFYLAPAAYREVVRDVLTSGAAYGRSDKGAGTRIIAEFVSANPTGPLHVGHGRHAAYGATVANLLRACGYSVHREYYVNDAGRQMDILATSVWLRYLESLGEKIQFPANGYRGEYIVDIAEELYSQVGDRLTRPAAQLLEGLPPDEPAGGDKELHIDALIERARTLLGQSDYRLVFDAGLKSILDDIRDDLAEFGVTYDEWFSERSLREQGFVEHALKRLEEQGHCYRKDGALWLRATEYGDEKDRVVVRENGQFTYFASDIAYQSPEASAASTSCSWCWGGSPRCNGTLSAGLEAMGERGDSIDVPDRCHALSRRREGADVHASGVRDSCALRGGRNDAAHLYGRGRTSNTDFDMEPTRPRQSRPLP
jgi:arginyl-tRNA synthetase